MFVGSKCDQKISTVKQQVNPQLEAVVEARKNLLSQVQSGLNQGKIQLLLSLPETIYNSTTNKYTEYKHSLINKKDEYTNKVMETYNNYKETATSKLGEYKQKVEDTEYYQKAVEKGKTIKDLGQS